MREGLVGTLKESKVKGRQLMGAVLGVLLGAAAFSVPLYAQWTGEIGAGYVWQTYAGNENVFISQYGLRPGTENVTYTGAVWLITSINSPSFVSCVPLLPPSASGEKSIIPVVGSMRRMGASIGAVAWMSQLDSWFRPIGPTQDTTTRPRTRPCSDLAPPARDIAAACFGFPPGGEIPKNRSLLRFETVPSPDPLIAIEGFFALLSHRGFQA